MYVVEHAQGVGFGLGAFKLMDVLTEPDVSFSDCDETTSFELADRFCNFVPG